GREDDERTPALLYTAFDADHLGDAGLLHVAGHRDAQAGALQSRHQLVPYPRRVRLPVDVAYVCVVAETVVIPGRGTWPAAAVEGDGKVLLEVALEYRMLRG